MRRLMTEKRMIVPRPDVQRTSVRLPLPENTTEGEDAAGDTLHAPRNTRAATANAPLGRVFVVDDDWSVLHALERLFRSFGLLVQTFDSPAAFCDHIVHDMPSCAVVDLMMPELTGLEIQERLIAMGEDLPLVFLSGQGDVPAATSAMRRGAVDFVVKPAEASALMDAVTRALTRDAESQVRKRIEGIAGERYARLTGREKQVCQLVAEGWLNKQIAAALGTAEKTIKQHRGRVMRKLEIQSVAALVRLLSHVPELNVNGRSAHS
jgi:FixJ family two-component response regulator